MIIEFSPQELEETNEKYKPEKFKEWHTYCWFIGPAVGSNFHMMCNKFCKITIRGGKRRFLGHLGCYSNEIKPCGKATSDAEKFAVFEMKKKRLHQSIRTERTKAIIDDDMKLSPEAQVRKMMQQDDTRRRSLQQRNNGRWLWKVIFIWYTEC